MTGCSFASGSANGGCDMIDCKCGVGCGATTKTIIEGTFSGKPVKVEVQDGSDEMSVIVEGAPLPLSATCKVAGCEQLGSAPASEIDTAATANADDDLSLTGGAVLAIVACAVLSVSLLLSCMAFCCSFAGTHRSRQEDDLETELLKVNSRSVDTLEFRNVSCFTDGEKQAAPKCILNKISGMVSRGQVLGLLGPSGSGKTTLLNALAAVQNGKSKVSGELLVDGNKVTRAYRRVAAYVQQDDTLYSTLTVRECITYSAQLRLPLSMTDAAKGAMVQRIIEELNLGHVANSRIGVVGGSSSERGISGGERRRVSIGMELVTSPRILILDEPTSGLDSSSAHSVVKLIKELASHDRIVVLSIHQPSARSFILLDKIILLGKGELLYYGSPANAKGSFNDLGFNCPDDDNIADFILDIASDTDSLQALQARQANTVSENVPTSGAVPASSQQSHLHKAVSSQTTLDSPLYKAESSPFMTDEASESRSLVASIQMTTVEIRVLVVRTAQNILRHRSLLVLHVALSLALALFGGLIFNNVTDDLAGFQNRMGAFYFTLTFFGFASMSSMDVFIGERQIFLRETGAMYYGAFSYFLAKTTLDSIFLRVLPASLFACIFYWIMGLQAAADRFLLFWLTVVLFNVAAGSICLFVGVLATRVGSANLGATVMLLIMLLFGGFLINSGTMPDSVGWLTHLSIFGYAFEILMVNELVGTTLSFDAPGYPAIPVYGEVYLRTLGMDYADRYYDVAALAAIACVLQFLALCFLLRQVPSNHDMVRYDQDDDVTVVGQKEAGHKACGPD
uniref:ABC transporter domain-containing protein n=1 Tax=Hyaloperonospora arabidopsidis (strain Emoy2) TaxID=559515 RepID=M4BS88_HYAAE